MATRKRPVQTLSPPPRLKNVLPRSEVPAGDCLCDHCAGKCCRYFSLPIETPEGWYDYDEISWYLAHGQTLIYVEKETWYLVVMTEYDEDWVFEKVFETPEQLWEYAEAVLPPRRAKRVEPAITMITPL